MIWAIDPAVFLAIGYAVVLVLGLATWYEVKRPTEDEFVRGIGNALLWPFFLCGTASMGVIWLIVMVARCPAKLAMWIMRRRSSLPRAMVIE